MDVLGNLKNGCLYLTICGEMDEHSAQSARTKCDELINDNVLAKKIIFNLEHVTFMDSTGIGFLIGRYKKTAKLNIPIYIYKPNFAADKILNLSGIYSLIPKID